jgi:hypothetical protein
MKMTRSDFLPRSKPSLLDEVPRILGALAGVKRQAIGISFDVLVHIGRELTRQIALAESEGDFQSVDRLLRRKDRLHRLRRELSNAGR